MNIVNLLSLLWAMFTWGLLNLIELPEEELNSIREKKKMQNSGDSTDSSKVLSLKKVDTLSQAQEITGKLMQSVDRFDNISILNLKMNQEKQKSEKKLN